MKIGQVYRYPKEINFKDKYIDGVPNYYYYYTYVKGYNTFTFQRGIHVCTAITAKNGDERIPLIIISSSPHKLGREDNPWYDRYDPDHGYVKYYGDNKTPDKKPEECAGNKALLNLFSIYQSNNKSDRAEKAVPVVFFERVTYNNKQKGYLKFQGYGILQSIELVTQYKNKSEYFSNYLYNFCIFSLKDEQEKFNWRKWIEKRCDVNYSTSDTNRYAPTSWKKWINAGSENLQTVRRRVSALNVIKKEEQIAEDKSKEKDILDTVYKYYENKKHNFELLAMEVEYHCITENGTQCTKGWITKGSGDNGIDFVLRADIGSGLAGVKMVVIGQAKCEKPGVPTSGRHIARTVAKLKRGWIGVYVTTSFFSEAVQEEVIEDEYPIIMINGKKLAEIINKILYETNMKLIEYLDSLEEILSNRIKNCIPEEILSF